MSILSTPNVWRLMNNSVCVSMRIQWNGHARVLEKSDALECNANIIVSFDTLIRYDIIYIYMYNMYISFLRNFFL